MNHNKRVIYADWLGISASGLCLIHCALTPLLFTAKPLYYGMIGRQVHNHGAWAALDYVFLILSFLAVWYAARNTSFITLKWVLWAAWIAFTIGLLLESMHLAFGHWLMYVGSITLVMAHIKNFYHGQHHCKIEVSN